MLLKRLTMASALLLISNPLWALVVEAKRVSPARQFDGASQTLTHDCGSSPNVQLNGTSNNLTVKGKCEKIEISGMGNSVQIETVSAIEVSGMNNKVTYKNGSGSQAPRIEQSGMGNSVTKAN